jgi:protein HOOK3
MLAAILHEIVPESFSLDGILMAVDGKWVLAAKNIRTVLKTLDEYFTNALAKKIRVEDINENDIAKNHSEEEIIKLVELIVGVAVFCENKQFFIGKIFELSADSQSVLKGLVQHVMESAEDLAVDTSDAFVDLDAAPAEEEEVTFGEPSAATQTASSEELLRAREMLAHMQQERSRLLGDLQSLETQNESLKHQLQQAAIQHSHSGAYHHASNNAGSAAALSDRPQAHDSYHGEDLAEYKQRLEHTEQANLSLRRELEDAKSSLDLRLNEVETLRQESRLTKQKWEAAVALQAKAEMEARAALDELDLARAKADRLFKVEQQLEKAQNRLEEMASLRRTNKELNDRLDSSLDKIHDLESSLKEVAAAQKNLEVSRAKNIEMERRLFESESLNASLDEQVKKLREDVWKTSERQRAAEDEARSLRMQMELISSSSSGGVESGTGGVAELQNQQEKDAHAMGDAADEEDEEDMFFSGNAATLRQRLRDTRRQLRQLQRQLGSDTEGHQAHHSTPGSGGAGSEDFAAQILALHQEIDDVKRQKRDREDLITTLRRQLSEVEMDRDSMRHRLADRDHVDTNASRDAQQRLVVLTNTVSRLEERLTERELLVTRLETEKSKLETYAKRSLMAFKEKFMSVIQTMREEKRDLEAKVKAQAERTEKAQDAWRREERLLSSALFEVGVKIMDRKIHANLAQQHGSGTPGNETFLATQREAVSRASTINAQQHSSSHNQQQHQQSGAVGDVGTMSPDTLPTGRRLFNPQTPGN